MSATASAILAVEASDSEDLPVFGAAPEDQCCYVHLTFHPATHSWVVAEPWLVQAYATYEQEVAHAAQLPASVDGRSEDGIHLLNPDSKDLQMASVYGALCFRRKGVKKDERHWGKWYHVRKVLASAPSFEASDALADPQTVQF